MIFLLFVGHLELVFTKCRTVGNATFLFAGPLGKILLSFAGQLGISFY